MSGLNQSFEQVFVLSNPTLLASGTTVDLAVGQVGIFDPEKGYAATASPTYAKNKALIFAQGRPDISHLGEFILNGFEGSSAKSKLVKGKKITGWTGKRASRGKQEIITVGYDGADITKNLKGYDGVNKNFYLKLTGQPMTKLYSEQGMIRNYVIGGECFECENTLTNPEKIADELVSKINGDKYINRYVRASKLLYDPTPASPTTVNFTRWNVSVTDTGDTGALAAVQVQYPGTQVKLVSRSGYLSTYEIVRLASLGTPTAVAITNSVVIPECTTCPVGYTFQGERKVFEISRSLAGNEVLVTTGNKQTYADTVKASYFVAKTFNGATAVDPTTDQITLTAHGLSVNQPLVYSNGGGTTVVGLTNGATYYVKTVIDANNITLSSTPGGTVIDITADGVGAAHTLTVASSASFVTNDAGVAKVLLSFDTTVADITAVLADTVNEIVTSGAYCVPGAGTTASWTNVETLLAYQKTLKITVGDDCGDTVLADIQAAYPNQVITLVGGTPTGNCVHMYNTNILSNPVSSDCSIEELKYTFPSSYKGVDWVDATVAVENTDVVAGVKIEAAFVDRITGECTYDYFPKEYDGIHLEASFYDPDYNADPCDVIEWPITKIQGIEYPHGDGYMVRKREDRQNSLHLRERSFSPAVREVEGYHSNSKLDRYYDEYALSFDFSYKVLGWSETYTDSYRIVFFVEEGQGKPLEDAINSYVTGTSVGLDPVVLH